MATRRRTKTAEAFAIRGVIAALFARWYEPRTDETALAVRDEYGTATLQSLSEVDALTPGNPGVEALTQPQRSRFALAFPVGLLLFVGLTAGTLVITDLSEVPPAPANLYVATSGSDVTGDGSSGNPWATAQHAVNRMVATGVNTGGTNVVINVGPGTYWDTNLIVTDAANPSTGRTVTLKAQNGINTVRLIGGHQLDTALCTVHSGDIYKCPVDAEFWTLFENGTRAQLARTPNIVPNATYPVAVEPFLESAGPNIYTAMTYQLGDIDPTGWEVSDIRVWGPTGPGWRWFTDMTPVTNVNTTTRVMTFSRETKYENSARWYVIQNVLEILDQEGEWYLDRNDVHGAPGAGGHYLYYWPRDLPITSQEIIYPTTSDTVSLLGTDEDNPVRGWVLQDIGIEVSDFVGDYRYATWGTGVPGQYNPTICDGAPMAACSWLFEAAEPNAQHGLVHLRNVDEGVKLARLHVKNSGLAGLYAQLHVQNIVVRDSWFEHCGFDCLQFEGGANSLGDKNNANRVDNCKINNPGETLQHGAGIRLANSGHNVLVNLDISQGPRNAIYITDISNVDTHTGYAWGNDVSFVAIDSMGQDSGDMGAIGVFALGSTTNTTAPKPTNRFDQITIDNTWAHPGMLNDAPNCVFFDNQSWWQIISNVDCSTTQGAERRLNDSGGHTETNVSWGAFNPALMSATIGLTAGFPY